MKEQQTHQPELVGAHTDKGPVRKANEDAFWIPDLQTPAEWGALYVVADGVGGQAEGAAAAQLAVLMVRDSFYRQREKGEKISEALKHACRRANQAVYEEAQARGGRMGCTLVAAVVDRGRLWIAHVGDARAYRLRDGRLIQLTRDDTWVQEQVDAQVITPEQAARHQFRNVVTQVLGNNPQVKVHLSTTDGLEASERLLLCSDGLHDTLEEAQMARLLLDNAPPDAARRLVETAAAAGAKDNITAVVVQYRRQSKPTELLAPAPVVAMPEAAPPAPGRRALWLGGGALFVLLLIGALLFFFVWRNGGQTAVSPTPDDGGNGALLPVATIPAPTAVLLATSTLAAPPQTAVVLEATSTLRSTETAVFATPTPPQTPELSPTAVTFACVRDGSLQFVWQQAQINAGTCDQFAQAGFVLLPGAMVELLDPEPISIAGPDSACQENDFVQVRAVDDPDLAGWVLQNGLRFLQPGATCDGE